MATSAVHDVCDAHTKESTQMRVKFDEHGAVVEVGKSARSIVLDLSDGLLRVFVTNPDGEVVNGPVGSLPVRFQ